MSYRRLILAAALAAVPVTAQSLTPRTDLLPGGAARIDLIIAGTAGQGLGVLMFAPERSGPLPTPWGALWLAPPTMIGFVPLTPTGMVSVPLPPGTPPFAAAFQAVTTDLAFTAATLTNYALVGYEPLPLVANPGEAAIGDYDSRTRSWRTIVIANPGADVTVAIREGDHVIFLQVAQVGPNGRLALNGTLTQGLRGADHIEVRINGRTAIRMR